MKHISLIVMLSVVGFAVSMVMFIASRLSAEEVALLAGVVCGIGVAVPLGVIAGVVVGARRRRDRPPAATLPVIYVAQPPAPTVVGSPLPQARLAQPGGRVPASRPLNIIGQNGFDADE